MTGRCRGLCEYMLPDGGFLYTGKVLQFILYCKNTPICTVYAIDFDVKHFIGLPLLDRALLW